jgi:hypothetical protein
MALPDSGVRVKQNKRAGIEIFGAHFSALYIINGINICMI